MNRDQITEILSNKAAFFALYDTPHTTDLDVALKLGLSKDTVRDTRLKHGIPSSGDRKAQARRRMAARKGRPRA